MKKFLALSLVLFVFSCAFPSTKDGMTIMDYKSPKRVGEKIFVKESKGGSITWPFWTSEIPNDNFTAAVKDSLLNSQAFSTLTDKWDENWGLEIEIVDVDQPLIGADLTVKTFIKYTLYLKGKKVYEKFIQEKGVATMEDTLLAIKRLRLANENSAKANIAKFIEELSKQNLN